MEEGKERTNVKPHSKTPKPKVAPAPQARPKEEKKDFNVFTYTVFDEPGYVHWAEGLSMVIRKGDVKIELDSDEIQQLVKALPRTIGGTYN